MAGEVIISALEISENKVTLITGEFLNSRLNVLKIDETAHRGIKKGYLTNQAGVVEAIKATVTNSSKLLGIAIERVILMIPDYLVKRTTRKVTVQVKGTDRRIRAKEINIAIKEAITRNQEPNLELINIICHRFLVNEVPFYEVPLNETADLLGVEMDLYYADRKITHQLVGACEKAGLPIIDICLCSYSAGKEMALFAQNEEKLFVCINMKENYTSLSLIHNNRLLSVETLKNGYGSWLRAIAEATKLSVEKVRELGRESLALDDFKNHYAVVYEESGDERYMLTQGELNKLAHGHVLKWISDVVSLCQPFAEKPQVVYYLYGDSCDIIGLTSLMERQLKAPVKYYIPATMGARKSGLTALLGAFYVYRDQLYLRDRVTNSIDADAFSRMIVNSYVKPEKNISNRFKNLFFERRSGG